jgi:hypothetical protein
VTENGVIGHRVSFVEVFLKQPTVGCICAAGAAEDSRGQQVM